MYLRKEGGEGFIKAKEKIIVNQIVQKKTRHRKLEVDLVRNATKGSVVCRYERGNKEHHIRNRNRKKKIKRQR